MLAAVLWWTRDPAPTPTAPPVAPPTAPVVAPPGPEPATALATPTVATSAEPAAPDARTTLAPTPTETGPRLRFDLVDERGRPHEGRSEIVWHSVGPNRGFPRQRDEPFAIDGTRADITVEVAGTYRVLARANGLVGEGTLPSVEAGEPVAQRPKLVLHRVDLVRGSIVDAAGNGIEGVDVLVRDEQIGQPPRSSARTDPLGAFTVEVPPGTRCRLYVGDTSYPWVPVVVLEPGAGSRTLDPIRVELHAATFQVQNADGTRAAGARIEGIGIDGGRFVAETDLDGRARATTLLRGRWRVNAELAGHGRATRAIEVPLVSDEPVLILLPR